MKPQFSLYLLIALLFPSATIAQLKKSKILRYDTAATAGTVVLSDGQQLQGRVSFNDNDGVVSLFIEEDDEVKSYNARELRQFQFYGKDVKRERIFYAFEHEDEGTGIKDAEFFEVLKELKTFVVLVRIERVKTEVRPGLRLKATNMVNKKSVKATQSQYIYFLGADGTMEPYLKILEKEIQHGLVDWNEDHYRYIDSDLFEKYTGKHYPALEAYAKENKLSFKRPEHIVTILNHYQKLGGS